MEGWRDGSGVRALVVLTEDPRFDSQHSNGGSQQSIVLTQGIQCLLVTSLGTRNTYGSYEATHSYT